jgi:hypothetical protein
MDGAFDHHAPLASLVLPASQHNISSQFIIPSSQNDSIVAEPRYDDDQRVSMQFESAMPKIEEQRQMNANASLSQLAFEEGSASLRNSQAFNSQMLNDSQQVQDFARDMGSLDPHSALNLSHAPFVPATYPVPAINFVLPSGPIDPQMFSLLSMMAQNQTGGQMQRLPDASPLPIPHPSLLKPEHKDSRAIRRGPMDEMRQLLRILVKLFPQAPLSHTTAPDTEGGASGGGNRLSERQIRDFLEFLGDAPEPEWGLPEGWGTYISELFSWAVGKRISREQAAGCARRKQGKSWEVIPHELAKLGIYCWAWPVPLTLEGIKEANEAAAEENKELLTNPRLIKMNVHQRPPLPRAISHPLSSPGEGHEEEAGDELGIAKWVYSLTHSIDIARLMSHLPFLNRLLGEMRNSQSQLPLEMDNVLSIAQPPSAGVEGSVEVGAKRHKSAHHSQGGVTPSLPQGVMVSPETSPPGNMLNVMGSAVAPSSAATPTTKIDSIDLSSLTPLECWNLAAKLIGNAGSGQEGSDALETSDRIRAIGTTIQAIGLEARSALSDLLPVIPKGYHEILVSLKTLEEKWMAISKRK